MRILVLWLLSMGAGAADISDPTRFMFVGDRESNLIDVVSIESGDVSLRIETRFVPDHIVVTPFAPILVYTGEDEKLAVFYDLEKQQEVKTIELPLVPRHVVMDTTGAKIGISDHRDGGFALLHAYKKTIEFSIDDFPPSSDVLFDPNDVDIYYSNERDGTLGLLDMNTQKTYEMVLVEGGGQRLTPPSRSLDSRYIYVGNIDEGVVYSLNAYSKIIFNTFEVSGVPARPYTTPEGVFLYLMDEQGGRLRSIEQQGFTEYTSASFDAGVNLVAVGRFDRMNLFLSTDNRRWRIYDNVARREVQSGELEGTPVNVFGSADGKTAFVALDGRPGVAMVDLEKHSVTYVDATDNGASAFAVGLSNNVCH